MSIYESLCVCVCGVRDGKNGSMLFMDVTELKTKLHILSKTN